MRSETESGDRRSSRDSMGILTDWPSARPPDSVATPRSRIGFADFRAFLPRARLIYPPPQIRSGTVTCDPRDFSRCPEDPNGLAVAPGRLSPGAFAPLAPRFRRLSYISGTPPLNLAVSPEMAPESAGSGGHSHRIFSADAAVSLVVVCLGRARC